MARVKRHRAGTGKVRAPGPAGRATTRRATSSLWALLLAAVMSLVAVNLGALGVGVSGQFGLDVSVRRIPSTLSGDIVLDTPTEYAELEFGIASDLNLKIDGGFASGLLDAVVNMAGPEHAVVMGDLPIEDLSLYGVVIDKLRFVPEMWFAVPFEAVTDVNNLSNSAVIPPGGALFVTSRITSTCTIGGFTVKHVVMFQDVNFPKPGVGFTTPPIGDPITVRGDGSGFWHREHPLRVVEVAGWVLRERDPWPEREPSEHERQRVLGRRQRRSGELVCVRVHQWDPFGLPHGGCRLADQCSDGRRIHRLDHPDDVRNPQLLRASVRRDGRWRLPGAVRQRGLVQRHSSLGQRGVLRVRRRAR